MKQLFYHIKTAIENIKLNQTMAFFSLVSLSLTLMLFGLFLLFYYNVQGFAQDMRERVQFSIYLEEEITQEALGALRGALDADERIASALYISKEEALRMFKQSFEDTALIERLGENPLPASFEVKVQRSHQEPERLAALVKHFQGRPGVEEVQYGSEWLQNLTDFLGLLRLIGVGVGGFIAVAVMTNIANTIRLHFYNRHEEIEIMKLIGATHAFIKIPFLIEGLLMGGISGGLSLVFLFLLFDRASGEINAFLGSMGRIEGLQFLPLDILFAILFTGGALGGIGSFISLNHLLRLRNPVYAKKKR